MRMYGTQYYRILSPRASLADFPSNPIAVRIILFLAGVIRSAKPKPKLRKNFTGKYRAKNPIK